MASSNGESHGSIYFMKRYGHLYAQMISRENLENAFDRAKRGKTWQRVVQEAIAHR